MAGCLSRTQISVIEIFPSIVVVVVVVVEGIPASGSYKQHLLSFLAYIEVYAMDGRLLRSFDRIQ